MTGMTGAYWMDRCRELETERDQLRQQVEKLLNRTDDLRRAAPGARGYFSRRLYQAAAQVRKELEG
jgi:hypothetical protein